jgi:hypothetical protein
MDPVIFLLGGIASTFLAENLKSKIFLIFAVISQFFILPETIQVLSSGIQIENYFNFNNPLERSTSD